jgi:hypothetical protein
MSGCLPCCCRSIVDDLLADGTHLPPSSDNRWLEKSSGRFALDRIAFLLGAGASKDAGLPLTGELTREVGEVISADRQLSRLADLYSLIVSAIIATTAS